MQFGMPTLIENNTLEDNLRLCKRCGFDFLELNMNLPEYQVEQLEKTAELKKLADDYSVFFTIHLDENLNVCDFNTAVSNAYLETISRTIDIAQRLGSPILNMHMHSGVYFTLPDKRIYLFEKYSDYYMEKIARFSEICTGAIGNSDLKICIENTDGYPDYQKKAIDYLLKSNAFALTWDIGHSHGVNNIDEPFIMKNISKLKHFHIHDGLGRKNHLTLGTGEIDLKQRLSVAETCGARCVVETKTINSLIKSSDYLKDNGYIL